MSVTVVDRLISPIDVIRMKIHARLGDRPYVVSTIRYKWSGGARGVGTLTETSRVLLSPPPLLVNNTDLETQEAGLDELGTIRASEISLSLTEDALTGGVLGIDEDFQWEVVYASGHTRYYTVAGMPIRDITNSFGYVVILKRLSDAN